MMFIDQIFFYVRFNFMCHGLYKDMDTATAILYTAKIQSVIK